MKVLLINARQPIHGMSKGKLNGHIAASIRQHLIEKSQEVRLTDIVEGYDIEQEVEKHL